MFKNTLHPSSKILPGRATAIIAAAVAFLALSHVQSHAQVVVDFDSLPAAFTTGEVVGQPTTDAAANQFKGTAGVYTVTTTNPQTGLQALTSTGTATGNVDYNPIGSGGFNPNVTIGDANADIISLKLSFAYNDRTGVTSGSQFAAFSLASIPDTGNSIFTLSFRGTGNVLLNNATANQLLIGGGSITDGTYVNLELILDYQNGTMAAKVNGADVALSNNVFRGSPGSNQLRMFFNVSNLDANRYAGITFDNLSVVPEPTSFALLLGSGAGILLLRRRRSNSR